jgi:serine phosphatase RsbU (regulator of sigma subunit)
MGKSPSPPWANGSSFRLDREDPYLHLHHVPVFVHDQDRSLRWDDLTREIEGRRRAIAEKLESERRAAQELEIAKQVQARLFSQTAARFKTLDYAGICLQARQVGGDYYDFLSLG